MEVGLSLGLGVTVGEAEGVAEAFGVGVGVGAYQLDSDRQAFTASAIPPLCDPCIFVIAQFPISAESSLQIFSASDDEIDIERARKVATH